MDFIFLFSISKNNLAKLSLFVSHSRGSESGFVHSAGAMQAHISIKIFRIRLLHFLYWVSLGLCAREAPLFLGSYTTIEERHYI